MEKGYKKLKKESDHENFLIVIWKEINGAVFSFFYLEFHWYLYMLQFKKKAHFFIQVSF